MIPLQVSLSVRNDYGLSADLNMQYIYMSTIIPRYTDFQNYISDVSHLKRSHVDNLHTPNYKRTNTVQ